MQCTRMSVAVKKSPSVIVRSSEPVTSTEGSSIKLSSYDMVGAAAPPTTLFLVFEHSIHEPAETIKRCLSEALVHYYPLAGRLAAGETANELVVECTGEGVPFVAAFAKCDLKDVMYKDKHVSKMLLDELAIYYPAPRCRATDPLLMMQVTEFSCGGFVVGVTRNHAITDGTGLGQFLQALGELARGLSSPSVVPVRHWDDKLVGFPPYKMHDARSLLQKSQPFDMATVDITIPWSIINRIKEESLITRNGGQPKPCTVFEALLALLWQCRTRATMSDPDAPTMLFFTVNARGYVGAKQGYYGNCATSQRVMAKSCAVAYGDIMDVVKTIQDAKDRIPEQFGDVFNSARAKDMGNSTQIQTDNQLSSDLEQLLGYNFFAVTSWRNIGLDGADFGGGRPARVLPYARHKVVMPVCVVCPPCKGKDGCNVVTRFLKEEHVNTFLAELARSFSA